MKTAKEKAKELVEKYAYHLWIDGICDYEQAKQCALIAVDEILDASLYYFDELSPYVIYWQEVKKEIEKL
jgi:pentose-5-phosphate-3-epimerase